MFSVEEMKSQPDHSVPYQEKRDSNELMRIPHYEDQAGIGPAGSIISSVQDMSRWLIALMNDGKYLNRQAIPTRVLNATLEPAIATPNTDLKARGYKELLNPVYGAGRHSASYRGHYFTYHGGSIGGCFSQVSSMTYDQIGVIVFVIGGHCSPLPNVITYNLYERVLGLDQTAWSERRLEVRRKAKGADKDARAKVGGDRITDTKPSHSLADYVGTYEHPAYDILKIEMKENELQFNFHKIRLALHHYHYDRFDTPDDELEGKWSVNFSTNSQGDADKALLSLDEAEATFTRKADPALTDPKTLEQYAGLYETATGMGFQVLLKDDKTLHLAYPGRVALSLIPYKQHKFRIKEFSDVYYEFIVENGKVKSMKTVDPSGEYQNIRK